MPPIQHHDAGLQAVKRLFVKDATVGGGGFELVELDLANLKNMRACADGLLTKGESLDAIIANAGVMATPFGHSADGFETQFDTVSLGRKVGFLSN